MEEKNWKGQKCDDNTPFEGGALLETQHRWRERENKTIHAHKPCNTRT